MTGSRSRLMAPPACGWKGECLLSRAGVAGFHSLRDWTAAEGMGRSCIRSAKLTHLFVLIVSSAVSVGGEEENEEKCTGSVAIQVSKWEDWSPSEGVWAAAPPYSVYWGEFNTERISPDIHNTFSIFVSSTASVWERKGLN